MKRFKLLLFISLTCNQIYSNNVGELKFSDQELSYLNDSAEDIVYVSNQMRETISQLDKDGKLDNPQHELLQFSQACQTNFKVVPTRVAQAAINQLLENNNVSQETKAIIQNYKENIDNKDAQFFKEGKKVVVNNLLVKDFIANQEDATLNVQHNNNLASFEIPVFANNSQAVTVRGTAAVRSGPVTGPASSTNTAIARWNGTTGSALLNSGVTIDNSNNVTVNTVSGSGANINMPNSALVSGKPVGTIEKAGAPFIHNLGGTFVGVGAGNLSSTGNFNTGVGSNSLHANTTGINNSGIGIDSLQSNTTGTNNTGIGPNSLKANTSGSNNIAVGPAALFANTTGGNNAAIGSFSLTANSTGGFNTGIGSNSLQANTTGANNTGIGPNSLFANTTGGSNVSIGPSSVSSNTTGSFNIGIGSTSLISNTTASNNIAIGTSSLQANTTGTPNIAIGSSALAANTTSGNNIAIGNASLLVNTAANNIGIGVNTLTNNTIGTPNIAIGSSALLSNTIGNNNIAIGANSLNANTNNDNIGIGVSSLSSNTTGNANVGIGSTSLTANTTGAGNSAVGIQSLAANTTGNGNTCLGAQSLLNNTTGSGNVAIGHVGLFLNTTGSDNTAIGLGTLANNTGSSNIALGFESGLNLTTGTNNIHIGNAGVAAETTTIKIGTPAVQTSCFIAGIRGTTTGSNDAISVLIDSNGQLGTTSSSRRYKRDIEEIKDEVIEKIMNLHPVQFKYNIDRDPSEKLQYGVIAEEAEPIMKELIVYDKERKPDTFQYHILPILLLKTIQYLRRKHSKQLEDLRNELNELKTKFK